ncbi:MAG TPA: DUF4097 family beta strand repeat-containing protein [Thermoanaerobaculia bacterium]|jgi:hypothetical protein
MRRAILVSSILILTAFAANADVIRKGFNVSEGGTFTLEADTGDVKVVSGGTGVAVEITREGSPEQLRENTITFDQSGSDVTVHSKYDHDRWFHWSRDPRIRYNIRVPSHYNVKLSTSGGDIDLGDLGGNADIHTSGGDIKVAHINGNLLGRTSGGDLRVASATGTMNVHSSGGDIDIENAGGALEAKTSGGSIEIGHAGSTLYAHSSGGNIRIREALDTIDASTSGGSIHAHLLRQPHGDSRLSTSGGDVVVEVPANLGAAVDAHTSGGDIDTDLPVTIMGRKADDNLVGTIGGGGPRLVLRTSGGGISLRKG